MTAARRILGPFGRVEGDLEVAVETVDGVVCSARVTAPLFRGFETILAGRDPSDALVIAPRICGICSVAQSTAAARALRHLGGVEPPPNGQLAADLVLAAENAADHLTHFALFFMPDFTRAAYAERPWFAAVARRYAAGHGESARILVAARARFLHLMGVLAGKWPHSLALQPGGTTRAIDGGERIRLLGILAEFRQGLEAVLFGDRLETVAGLDSPTALAAWAGSGGGGDMRLFLTIAEDLGLGELGRGPAAFLSAGAFGLWRSGTAIGGVPAPFDPAAIVEDNAHAWLSGPPAPPASGLTRPDADKPDAYTWCKAPRLDGRVMEVGALARHVVDRDPLALGLVGAGGGSVRDRVVLRLVELARLIPAMEGWVRALTPGAPFCTESAFPLQGTGIGLVEAARGTLGHWLGTVAGRIARYQIVAPTTWNFSPRDEAGIPGALEQALVGTPVDRVEHVVRSFDPCMACTVH
ncbi:MAG: nickel-dependent hydrogenase large subunit [Magnetospirillum sp.]|nr:nickel-dependent hydrogenase large subunit [Magnetospirillum sp.]